MSDMIEQGLAYFDQQVEPDAAPEGAPEGGTPDSQPEPAAAARARDEQGRFASEPKPEPAQTPDETAAEPQLDEKYVSYLGRFGIDPGILESLPDEVRKQMEAGFEADRTIGRQGQEYGEKIRTLEELLTQTQTAPEPQPTVTPRYDRDQTLEYLADNPAQIIPTINDAYTRGDRNLLYLGIAALQDHDPVAAESIRVDLAKRDALAEMEPHIARSQQNELQQNLARTWTEVKRDHPDIDAYADKILEAANADPGLLSGLTQGSSEAAARTLINLYKIVAFDARQENAQLLADAGQQSAEQQALEAKAAKHDAFVATGSQRVDPQPQTPADPILDAFDKAFANSRYAPHE